MPTLHWIGKEKIVNHHRDVPFHTLKHQYNFNTDSPSENKIIQGDNLLALKSLLPEYEGRIKCIYIDPPYNTGNEGWVYNDNVSDPRLKKWLNAVVGKEGEDLSRHDKWLCMMYPRLQLLRRLLADNGAIFISIDDNEQANLKLICDEIFGGGNFKGIFIWKSRQIVDSRNQDMISKDHEYILIYSKTSLFKLRGKLSDKSKYSNPDNDKRGAWMSNSILGLANKEQRPNLHYEITDPDTGIIYDCPADTGWRYSKETMASKINEKRIFFPKKQGGRPREKKFLMELASDFTGFSTILGESVGYTLNGTRTVREIIPEAQFAFPKPFELVQEIIEQATNHNSIILDSFAGSGTTAHAVLNMNEKDGGNRKFILVEMEAYAENITAERVRRVISQKEKEGIKETDNQQVSIDFPSEPKAKVGFSYYTLGEALFDPIEDELNENAPLYDLQAYIWYSETRSPYQATPQGYYLGEQHGVAYFFAYERERSTCLNASFLAQALDYQADKYVIYADACLLSDEQLLKNNVKFKKIPRQIIRI